MATNDSVSPTAMQKAERVLLAAHADYDRASTDEEYTAAHTRLADAVKALALTTVERPSDYLILVRHARIIAHDEAQDGEWLDGRFKLLLAAVEIAANAMVDRIADLERQLAGTRAAA